MQRACVLHARLALILKSGSARGRDRVRNARARSPPEASASSMNVSGEFAAERNHPTVPGTYRKRTPVKNLFLSPPCVQSPAAALRPLTCCHTSPFPTHHLALTPHTLAPAASSTCTSNPDSGIDLRSIRHLRVNPRPARLLTFSPCGRRVALRVSRRVG